MNTHSIDLIRYRAQSRGNSTIYLGTAGSHGNEQLQVTQGKGWKGLTVQVVFHPCKVAVQLPANGVLDVPWEATAQPLTAMQGRIVFQGFDQDRLVNSTDLAYSVASHSPTLGRDEQPYTPGIVEGVLNQMAADKDAILQAAQQTGQAKEAAAASAAAAASSAANAQQSAGAANTSAGQAAASASQAAGSAAAANETLTQVQTAGQEAQQKVKDAETEALGNISAAAPALPAVSAAAAWQSVTVKPDGTGYNLAAMAPIEATIRPTVTGNPAVCKDSAAWAFQGLKIYGKSTQDGTPSPENPVPIVSAGEGGSVETQVSGLNLFNLEDTTDGKSVRYTDGAIVDSPGYFISSYIPVFPGLVYWLSRDGSLVMSGEPWLYDKNKNPVARFSQYNGKSIPANAAFIIVSMSISFKQSIMLHFGAAQQPFAQYIGKTFSISTPNGLPGIPVESGGNFTDANGQQLVCDVKDYDAGKYIQNCRKIVLDGSDDEAISILANSGSTQRFILQTGTHYPSDTLSPIICSHFAPSNGVYSWPTNGGNIDSYSGQIAFVNNSIRFAADFSDVQAFKNWLKENPVKVIFGIDTPAETDIPAEELAAYKALATYDGTTVVSTAEPVAGIEARYVMDGNKYRESVDKRLAALEAAQTGI